MEIGVDTAANGTRKGLSLGNRNMFTAPMVAETLELSHVFRSIDWTWQRQPMTRMQNPEFRKGERPYF